MFLLTTKMNMRYPGRYYEVNEGFPTFVFCLSVVSVVAGRVLEDIDEDRLEFLEDDSRNGEVPF